MANRRKHMRYNSEVWVNRGRNVVIASIALGTLLFLSPQLFKSPDLSELNKQPEPQIIQTLYVAPNGNNQNSGRTVSEPFGTIQHALNTATPGTKIQLADGEYQQTIQSTKGGEHGKPIIISGTDKAEVRSPKSGGRLVEINHDYIWLNGFRINGLQPNTTGASKEDYADKLVYVIGINKNDGVEGLKIDHMTIQNAGGECVRLRYLAKNNEISNSTIRDCGIYDYRFNDGGKNGEGIYIGTAPEQRKDGKNPTDDVDESQKNYVHHNTIETNGNECVDIKEGAFDNLIEHNQCSKQKDPNSGGFDSRGNNNTFRYNSVQNTAGVGIRLGGDTSEDGLGNNVYENTFVSTSSGGVRTTRLPQGKICSNRFVNIKESAHYLGFNNTKDLKTACK